MTLRFAEHKSKLSAWSLRGALLSLQVFVLAVVLHRFLSLPTPVALNLLSLAALGGVVAAVVAYWSILRIWSYGGGGFANAAFAILIGLGLALWPAAYLPEVMRLPAITDVATDTTTPPPFVRLAAFRVDGANPPAYPGAAVASLQQQAYPDVVPVITPQPVGEIYELVRALAQRLAWEVVAEVPPDRNGVGRIEAVERSLVMGFPDDIAIRVSGDDRMTRIDVRSSSRYGVHDLGRNADRVRTVIREIYASLDASITASEVAAANAADGAELSSDSKKPTADQASRRKKRDRAQLNARYERARKAQQRQRSRRRLLDTERRR